LFRLNGVVSSPDAVAAAACISATRPAIVDGLVILPVPFMGGRRWAATTRTHLLVIQANGHTGSK